MDLPVQVALLPEDGELLIVLRDDLAAILTFAANKKKPDFLSETGLLGDLISPVSPESVVAGTRFHLNLRYPSPAKLNGILRCVCRFLSHSRAVRNPSLTRGHDLSWP